MIPTLRSLEDVLRHVTALPARELRREAIRIWLRALPASAVSVQLDDLLRRCMRRERAALDAVLAFADYRLHPDEKDPLVLEALDLEAARGEQRGALMLLSELPAGREIDAVQRRNMQLRKHVPLGMRRWWARLGQRAKLDVLMSDPDPVVVEHLCANPRVREDDVVSIAARRPNWPDVLDAVARSRWLPNEPVQRALIQNPYGRASLAITLMPLMPGPFLASLRFVRDLHPALPETAAYLLNLLGAAES